MSPTHSRTHPLARRPSPYAPKRRGRAGVWLHFGLIAAALLGAVSAWAQAGLPPTVSAALARAKLPPDAVTVLVQEAGNPARTLVQHRSQVPVNPASVMKLLTTYSALDILGPTFTWTTPVYVEGTVREGVLTGNVYIKGQGDPWLVQERVWLLMRRLQGLGIQKINGDVVLDRSAFELSPADPGEFDGERLRAYNVAPDALLINFNSLLLTFTPDPSAQVARVLLEPPLSGVQVPATVPLMDGACNDWRAPLRADFSDPARIRLDGRYLVACKETVWPVAYPQPAGFAARAVEGVWRGLGGQLGGKVREGRVPTGLAPAFEVSSPTLAEVIRTINKYSNNVMAQQLFLTLSLQARGVGTLAESRTLVQDWWRERLGGAELPQVENGSGLSRSDRISAQALARLLLWGWASPFMPEMLASLPITGTDGTLKRMRNSAQGQAHLKTGSLRDVTGVAGYVDAASGKRYVLVAIANHANAQAARPAIDALVEWVAKDH